MWKMLTEAPGDLRIELLEHDADEASGTAHWKAHYVFTETGRPVVNDIHASFRFRGGLILDHRDEFSFYAWARQALGAPGVLLGWTPIVRGAVRRKAAARLDEYIAATGAARGRDDEHRDRDGSGRRSKAPGCRRAPTSRGS